MSATCSLQLWSQEKVSIVYCLQARCGACECTWQPSEFPAQFCAFTGLLYVALGNSGVFYFPI